MPARNVIASVTKSFLMNFPRRSKRSYSSSMNFGGALQRLFQLLQRKILAAGDVENRRLAAGAEFAGIRHLGSDIVRNHDRAVAVGVNEIIGSYRHAGDANFAAKAFGVDPGVGRTDRACQRLESRRPLRDIADRAVGNDAEAAERLVHVALDLAPECAIADIGAVDILDHGDARTEAGADIFVIGDAPLCLLVSRQARL